MTTTRLLAPVDHLASPTDDALAAAPVVPLRHVGRWVSAAALLVLVAMAVHSLVANPRFQWHTVWLYLPEKHVLAGLGLTLWLSAATMAAGSLLGIVIALMRLSDNPVLRTVSFGYVWVIRSVPLLVQLLFWYELASLYPRLSLGIPFGPEVASTRTAHLFSGIVAALVALTLDVAALSSEIVRGGLLGVDQGQREAADALGLSPLRTFRKIVLPQAMPSIVPNAGNLLIAVVKATAVVSVIAVSDLLYSVELIYNDNYLIIPLLLTAVVWYVAVVTVLSVGQFFVERHYARSKGSDRRGFRRVLRGNVPVFGGLS